MHPSSYMVVWLAGIIATQFLSPVALVLLATVICLAGRTVMASWIGYLQRARLLLASLWLILAYNTPGEAFLDLSWAPTEEGIDEATIQALRLIIMLGGLAWLFDRLGRNGLFNALGGLLLPLSRLGVDARRFVLRLALVLANLEQAPEKGAWRKILSGDLPRYSGPDHWVMTSTPLGASDALGVGAALVFFSGALLL